MSESAHFQRQVDEAFQVNNDLGSQLVHTVMQKDELERLNQQNAIKLRNSTIMLSINSLRCTSNSRVPRPVLMSLITCALRRNSKPRRW